MKAYTWWLGALLLLIDLVAPAPAEVMGGINQVDRRVDCLKGGKLPAEPTKSGDGLEVGDVPRTKSLSKAQITFLDNTVIIASPETRFAAEEFRFDADKAKRNAMLQIFQGLAQAVVSKILHKSVPDFAVKTHTCLNGSLLSYAGNTDFNQLPAGNTTVGVVAGRASGVQTGVSTVQAVKTVGTATTPTAYVGTTTLTPAAGGATPTPATLTTTLQGLNPATVPGVGQVGAQQTGTVAVVPR